MNNGRHLSFFKEHLLSMVVFVALIFLLLLGLDNAQQSSQAQRLEIVEQSISRAIVTCYAIEGIYPPDVAYLQDYYGLVIDQSRYYIDYQVFASNIMPEVTVIEVGL